ncbi:hypothetical protein [Bacillus alkalicellulosilyticus]|uniref:hypothetical protein n=1 Tax=Alkalihalobacterium alkalicellulosilyticum TaxID=1912214 RepID=UPI001483975B|nr:hypothetical protein [Bacillus alkalicellulosilyticus]
MKQNLKEILLYLLWITSGLLIGALIFIPIFEDTFMGLLMGFGIGTGTWLATNKKKKR